MQQADLSRQKNQALSDLEAEAREHAQYLLERANTLRMEQEDEVKKLNEVRVVFSLNCYVCVCGCLWRVFTRAFMCYHNSAADPGGAVPCGEGHSDTGEEADSVRVAGGGA